MRFLVVVCFALLLAGCSSAPIEYDRQPKGDTLQQQLVSLADLNFREAQSMAERKGFADARDVGFAVSSGLNGGLLGGLGGAATLIAAPATQRELITHLFAEFPAGEDHSQFQGRIEAVAAPLIDRDPSQVGVAFTRYGRLGANEVHGVSVFAKDEFWNNDGVEAIAVYKKLVDAFPSALSVYVPPLRNSDGWSAPYLYRNGRQLTLN